MATIRVGLIGCGAAASWHATGMASSERFEIAALVDPSEANLVRLRERVPSVAAVPAFAGVEPMYAEVELDAVAVVTPHTLHYPLVFDAVERGLHVYCEKPLTCRAGHARAIEAAAEAAGVAVLVGYQRRRDPAYGYMKRVIENGDLGELRGISVCCGQRWLSATAGTWRQEPSLSGGGFLMDSGSHLADMFLWLSDRPVRSVSALVDCLGTPVDIDTTATVEFADGLQGQLTALGGLPHATEWIESVLVTGSRGLLRYDIEPQHPWRTGRVVHYGDRGLLQPTGLPDPPSLLIHWADAIDGIAPNPSPPAAAVRVAELTEAIYESGRECRRVSLDGPIGSASGGEPTAEPETQPARETIPG